MAKATDPLTALLNSAEKKYNLKVGSLQDVAEDIKAISTGNSAIDYAMGQGVPLGRSVEFYGLPSSGKTTAALQTAANLQKIIRNGGDKNLGIAKDDVILYLDYEQAIDKEYAEKLGLDMAHESFLFTQPDTLESGTNFALQALETGRIRLIIFDSVAAMNPSVKAEAEIGKSLPAVAAKLMKDFMMNLNPVLYKNNASALFLNHQMEKMSMGGRPGMPPAQTTPGGIALKYFASVRVQFSKIREIKQDVVDPLTGELTPQALASDVRIKIAKNKVAPPFREVIVRVRFGEGFDELATALQVLIAHKKIVYATGYYKFHRLEEAGLAPEWMPRAKAGTNPPQIHGEKKVYAAAKAHPEWRDALISMAQDIIKEAGTGMKLAEEEEGDEE